MANPLTEAACLTIADNDTPAETIARQAAAINEMRAEAAEWSYSAIDDAIDFLGRHHDATTVRAIGEAVYGCSVGRTKKAALREIHRWIAGMKECRERCSF